MKVLIQNRDYSSHFGGDQVMTEGLMKGLQALGHEVDYSHEWSPDLSKYDIVHLWHANMGWTKYQVDNCLRQNKKYVITTLYYSEGDQSFVDHILGNASAVISNSSQELGEIVMPSRALRAPKYIIENGVNDMYLRHGVFCAGRYEDFKGQLRVLEACKSLGIPVTVAGSLGDQSYKDRCLAFGYGEVLGDLNKEEMLSMYDKSRVYVCATDHERNSVCAWEAKSRGCKLVVTNGNRGNTELKPDATFSPRDHKDLVAQLSKTYFEYPKSFKEVAEDYLEVYKEALNG